jgi:hypothetical protein
LRDAGARQPLPAIHGAALRQVRINLFSVLFAFCVPMPLPQAHAGPPAIPIDDFDASAFQCAADG